MRTLIAIVIICACGCSAIKRVPRHENTLFIRADAESMTEDIVRDILKSPTTAQFLLETRIGPNKNFAMVMGRVASENSFGAPISVPIQAMYFNDRGTMQTALLIFDNKLLIDDEELKAKCR